MNSREITEVSPSPDAGAQDRTSAEAKKREEISNKSPSSDSSQATTGTLNPKKPIAKPKQVRLLLMKSCSLSVHVCAALQNKQQVSKAAAKRSPKPGSSQSSRDSSKSGTPVAGSSDRPATLIIDYTSTHLEPEASPSPPPVMPLEESNEQKDPKEECPSASRSRESSARPTRQSKGASSRPAKRTTPPLVDSGVVRRSKRKCTTPAYLIMCTLPLNIPTPSSLYIEQVQ